MSARRSIAQRQMPPPQQSRQQPQQQQQQFSNNQQNDGQMDIKKMHPMAVLSMHEDRLNEMDDRISQLQSASSSTKRSTSSGDESSMIAECIKQIKFLTQENQTNRNLARELTLEVLRLKTSLQEEGKIKMHVSEETQDKFEMFKETANVKQQQKQTQSQNVREELLADNDNGAGTMSFSGNGYDPNSL